MLRKKNKYIDFTKEEWKTDSLIGLQITSRPYKRAILSIFLILASISLIIPDMGLGLMSGIKVLRRFG